MPICQTYQKETNIIRFIKEKLSYSAGKERPHTQFIAIIFNGIYLYFCKSMKQPTKFCVELKKGH